MQLMQLIHDNEQIYDRDWQANLYEAVVGWQCILNRELEASRFSYYYESLVASDSLFTFVNTTWQWFVFSLRYQNKDKQ